jgi:hypothetical protein
MRASRSTRRASGDFACPDGNDTLMRRVSFKTLESIVTTKARRISLGPRITRK